MSFSSWISDFCQHITHLFKMPLSPSVPSASIAIIHAQISFKYNHVESLRGKLCLLQGPLKTMLCYLVINLEMATLLALTSCSLSKLENCSKPDKDGCPSPHLPWRRVNPQLRSQVKSESQGIQCNPSKNGLP